MIIKPSNTLKIRHHKVLDAYFAERIDTPQYKKSDKKEPVKYKIVSGDTLSKIAKKHNTTVAKIKADNGLISDTIYVGKTLSIGSQPKKEKIGDKVTFKKLKSANLGDEVYVVVKTLNLANKKVWLNVKQGKVEKLKLETEEKGLMLQHDKGANTQAEAVVGAYTKDDKITNKTDFKDWAIFKVTLGGKDTKEEKEELDKLKDKKAFMYLLVDAHTPNDIKVVYNGRNPDKNGEPDKRTTPNQWLDIDSKWFELKKGCDCGEEFQTKIKCTRYKYKTDDKGVKHYWYGPYYKGSKSIDTFSHWDTMITNNELTSDEKTIMIYMSPNEGNFDSVQSYDSVVLTAGAMQKTINNKGNGELPRQIWEFKQEEPELFQKYLGACCKWTVEKTGTKSGKFWGENENYTMYYEKSNKTKITGKELKKFIRKEFNKDNYGKSNIASAAILPIIKLMLDEKFLQKQIKDFKFRLDYSLSTKVSNHKISEYLKSNFGRALILDQHVNAPAWVKPDFQSSLNKFFDKKDKEIDDFNKKEKDKKKHKTKISRNPNDWGSNHNAYENEIIKDYGTTRRGTDMKARYNKIKKKARK